MATTPFDSAIYRDLFHDAEIGKLFSDSAEIRAMMIAEGALARAQGELGVIPELSAAAIHRAAMEIPLDPGALAASTGQNGVPVPGFVKAFRDAMNAPEHGQYLHFGATSQDIMETGQTLRLRQYLNLLEPHVASITRRLADLADIHHDLPMAGRTYGQVAAYTSFGGVAAGWGQPLLQLVRKLEDIRPEVLCVSLSGAAGTLSAMGEVGPKIRAAFASQLGLNDPGHSWHSSRARIGTLAAWLTQIAVALGKIGEDLIAMTQSGIAEVALGKVGASSTMPQKQNPVAPSAVVALSRHAVGLNGLVQGAGLHKQQRDGSAWMQEWLSLPQLCMATARAISLSDTMLHSLKPRPDAMQANAEGHHGVIHAEALSFALPLPRPEAQACVKDLCERAVQTGTPLKSLAMNAFPDLDPSVFSPNMGTAPQDAKEFARTVRDLQD